MFIVHNTKNQVLSQQRAITVYCLFMLTIINLLHIQHINNYYSNITAAVVRQNATKVIVKSAAKVNHTNMKQRQE